MIKFRTFVVAVLTAAAGIASISFASETISYKYDARGRLVQVYHTGSANNNVLSNYTFDKADNRILVNVTGAP